MIRRVLDPHGPRDCMHRAREAVDRSRRRGGAIEELLDERRLLITGRHADGGAQRGGPGFPVCGKASEDSLKGLERHAVFPIVRATNQTIS
jgi:hypothetical protein